MNTGHMTDLVEQKDGLQCCPLWVFRAQSETVNVDHEEKQFCPLHVLQEVVAHANVHVRSFYQPGKVCH